MCNFPSPDFCAHNVLHKPDARRVYTEKSLTPTGLLWYTKCPLFHCFGSERAL